MFNKRAAVILLLSCALELGSQNDSLPVQNIPLFSAPAESESAADQQDYSMLLQASTDLFYQMSSFQYGSSGFRPRGLAGENQLVTINGINSADPESGYSSWSNWGGLNDVMRSVENRAGISPGRYGFSGPAGYLNIESHASALKKATRFSYGNTNRVFRNKVSFSYNSGLGLRGWTLCMAASLRHGNEVIIPGTSFTAHSYYFSIDKKLKASQKLSFTGFMASVQQGRTKANTAEAYDLAHNNYYNSNWGYQNGKKRNAALSHERKTTFMLAHILDKGTARLTSTAYLRTGYSAYSGITSHNAPQFRPDYYRNLPSYYLLSGDTLKANAVEEIWEDENFRQINWDRLIAMNQANLYTAPHLAGQGINTSETRARYILESQVSRSQQVGLNINLHKRLKHFFFSAGFDAHLYKSDKYKQVEDLLGASYWVDVDEFAEGLGVEESIIQNDIDRPNRKVREGEKFGYGYAIHIRKAEAWALAEFSRKKHSLYLQANVAASAAYREGHITNGKFPATSKGRSETTSFLTPAMKAGYTYDLRPNHYLTLNLIWQLRAPETANLFIAPRVRNDMVQDAKPEKVQAGDLNYLIKERKFKLKFSAYWVQINDQLWLRSYYSDDFKTNVNLLMRDVDQRHQGVELASEIQIWSRHYLLASIGLGQNYYTSRPVLQGWQDNNSLVLFEARTVYLRNYHLPGPSTVAGIGYKINGKKSWFAGVYFNHIRDNYVEISPVKRTQEITEKYQENESELAAGIIRQEQLKPYSLVNANIGKTFRWRKKYQLVAHLSLNNLLNVSAIARGSENLRFNPVYPTLFANRYSYHTPRTYMLTFNFSF